MSSFFKCFEPKLKPIFRLVVGDGRARSRFHDAVQYVIGDSSTLPALEDARERDSRLQARAHALPQQGPSRVVGSEG